MASYKKCYPYDDNDVINNKENEIFEKISKLENITYANISKECKFNFVMDDRIAIEERLKLIDFILVKCLHEKEYRAEYFKSLGWVRSNNSCDTEGVYNRFMADVDIIFKKELKYEILKNFGFVNFSKNELKNEKSKIYVRNCAILQRKIPELKASINNNNEIEITYKSKEEPESKLQCLFRHLRNSIAHNNVYIIDNDKLLFVDYEKENVSAAIILEKKKLLEWIDILERRKLSNENEYNNNSNLDF